MFGSFCFPEYFHLRWNCIFLPGKQMIIWIACCLNLFGTSFCLLYVGQAQNLHWGKVKRKAGKEATQRMTTWTPWILALIQMLLGEAGRFPVFSAFDRLGIFKFILKNVDNFFPTVPSIICWIYGIVRN